MTPFVRYMCYCTDICVVVHVLLYRVFMYTCYCTDMRVIIQIYVLLYELFDV